VVRREQEDTYKFFPIILTQLSHKIFPE